MLWRYFGFLRRLLVKKCAGVSEERTDSIVTVTEFVKKKEAARLIETSGHVIGTLRENSKGRQSFDQLLPVKTVYVLCS